VGGLCSGLYVGLAAELGKNKRLGENMTEANIDLRSTDTKSYDPNGATSGGERLSILRWSGLLSLRRTRAQNF